MKDLYPLEKTISYSFKNRDLLDEALQHRSYVNESQDPGLKDNERLEFLGDAVLNLIVSHLLMHFHPGIQEGDLSRCRAGLVNETSLADISRKIKLGGFLCLGRGEEQANGREKDSILANAFEALVAAVYLDGGFPTAMEIIGAYFRETVLSAPAATASPDYKSTLQELAQQQHGTIPDYTVIGETGPDHDKTFHVRAQLPDFGVEGSGKSKKAAEKEAARKAVEWLRKKQRADRIDIA
jgi:ribonuclease III